MTTEKYLALRDGEVRKANALIQKSRYNLSTQQQKILLYLISQIRPYDEDFKLYEFDILDFCKVCGIDSTSGKNYETLKQQIKQIADKSYWITLEDGDTETLLRWIEKPYIKKRSGVIQIRLDNDMRPFLLKLKEHYTKYELIYTLRFRCKYSIRLYELIKSVHFHDLDPYTVRYTVEDLAGLIGAERYKEYRDFKHRALLPAVQEINEFSDKTLTYTEIKTGRKVTAIELVISSKDSFEIIKLRDRIEKELGTDQMTLWDQMQERGVN